MQKVPKKAFRSEDGLDFGVDGDVCGRNSINQVFFAGGFRELEEAADVIILVVTGEKALRFCFRQTKSEKRNRLSKTAGLRAV